MNFLLKKKTIHGAIAAGKVCQNVGVTSNFMKNNFFSNRQKYSKLTYVKVSEASWLCLKPLGE
jgi:hypothetical protein